MTSTSEHAADTERDQALRQQLKTSLNNAQPADTQALQARVLAQWRQAQPHQLVTVGAGPVPPCGPPGGSTRCAGLARCCCWPWACGCCAPCRTRRWTN